MQQDVVAEAFLSLDDAYGEWCRANGREGPSLFGQAQMDRSAFDPGSYHPWEKFVAFNDCLSAALGRPESLEALIPVCSIWATRARPIAGFRIMLKVFTRPVDVYRALWLWVGPKMFRPLVPQLTVLGPDHLRLQLSLPAEFEPSLPYFRWAVLAATFVPMIFDLPQASLLKLELADRSCDFELKLPRRLGIRALFERSAGRLKGGPNLAHELLEAKREARAAEEVQAEIWNSGRIGFCLVQHGRVVRANQTFRRAAGFLPTPAPAAFASLFSEEYRQDAEAIALGLLEECVMSVPGAPVRWLECQASGTLPYSGEPALLLLVRDVTDTKRLEGLLRERHRLSSLGHIAGSLGHEIATPLAVIRANLELHVAEAGTSRRVEVALRNIDHLAKVCSGLLNVSRVSKTPPTQVDMKRALQHALEVVSPFAKEREVKVDMVSFEQVYRNCREHEIVQAVVHLLTNAIDASAEAGKPMVRLILERDATIKVIDRGPGLPATLIENLNQPFYSTKPHGTGLGLTTVDRLLRDNDSHLSYQRQGEETCMSFRIPSSLKAT